jgi:hypothetical protein
VVTVLENRYRNGLTQDIILENNSAVGGQNALFVKAFGPMGPDRGTGRLERDVPDAVAVRRELAERFPGVHMEVSGLYAQNRYGPFSYATGRAATGDNCVYAWQRIAAEGQVFSFRRGAITWRLRVCDPHTSLRELLLLAYGLTITGYFLSPNWNPYGDPPKPDPRIGEAGETVLPQQPVDPTVVAPSSFGREVEPTVSAPQPAARPVSRAEAQREPVVNEPLPGAVVVPRPQASTLDEPRVDDANLPRNAPPPRQGLDVPLPPGGSRDDGSRPGASGLSRPPAGPRVVVPGPTASDSRSVRIVGANPS